MELIVEDGANLLFAREVDIDGYPFRLTWSSGWYLHLLEQLSFQKVRSKALRAFRNELQSFEKLGEDIASDIEGSVRPSAAGQVLVDLQRLSHILHRRAENVERTISGFLHHLAAKNSSSLAGLEFKFKSPESLMRKLKLRLRGLLERNKLHPLYIPRVSDIAHEVDDVLRYTVVTEKDAYAPTVQEFSRALVSELRCNVKNINFWQPGSTYFGVNAYVSMENFTFEIQFHTPESWRVKEKEAHELYRAFRLLFAGRAKFIIYRSMKEAWGTVPIPPSVELITPTQTFQDRLMEQIERIEACKKFVQSGMRRSSETRLDTAELCYRLIRGRSPEEFEYLAYPPKEKKLAWVSQSEKLQEILSAAAAPLHEMAPLIGHAMGKPLAWVEGKLRDGYTWKVAIMPQELCERADWDGCLKLLGKFYPEAVAKIARFRKALITTPFAEIERQISPPSSFRAIKDAGESHEQFINLAKLTNLAEPKLWQVRAFLFNVMGLNELYKGDGYTYNESGEPYSMEFMVENKRIDGVIGCELLTIGQ
jgi:hypothetical protein